MHRTWKVAPHDDGYLHDLCQALRVSPLVGRVLLARGYRDDAAATQFLARKLTDLHDPELLPGIPAAADRIVEAIRNRRKITIYGDYDVDGVTATSLLWHCLKLAGAATTEYYIPARLEEGYGLNCDALRQLHQQDPAQLVITVDCGITSVAEARLARELGLELIITDHHNFSESLPDAVALVHPRLPGSQYPFGELCGAGVAFKLAWAVCARLGDGKKTSPLLREFLLGAIGLAAIGTVADVVPLVDENRVLVHYGLGSLVGRANPGLKALLQIAKLGDKKVLQAEDIGFAIAPRINAAGRLGQARLAVELLTTDQPDRAVALATYLDELNRNRQTVERRMLKQAKELLEEHPDWLEQRSLVLSHPDWHAGVIGIVAGRVAETYQRPAVLIAMNTPQNIGQGSARTFGGFNLHAALERCRQHLRSFGGHHAAAGLKIEPSRIDEFRQSLHEVVAESQTDLPGEAILAIDAEVQFAEIHHRSVTDLDTLGPFGSSNKRPVFTASRVELAGPPRTMGEGDRHLSLMVRQANQTFRAIAFGKGEWAAELQTHNAPFAICFQPIINEFRGQQNVELQLLDWRAK